MYAIRSYYASSVQVRFMEKQQPPLRAIFPGRVVITSYSIHYTKLYDSRITFDGKYNTNPSISPDGKLLTYARLTPEGQRIWMRDLATGAERQISFGPGDDEDPSFAPDGYYVAFASSRTGQWKIYLTVITSYSIHYTKLYDILEKFDPEDKYKM